LLQLAKTVLPRAMLKMHYRSEFRELIEFSNNAFYRGELNVPVRHPETESSQHRPIDLIEVNGLYENRTNRAEAERVVNYVGALWSKHGTSAPSVGVVTFNRDQADLIEEVLEERAERDPRFRAAYTREMQRVEDGEDVGFFVKNVENVQGDERDIIVFSTTFGRNPQGAFRRYFGVLGQSGGERRLNVAVTRARRKIAILTSMPIAEIADFLASGAPPRQPRDYLQAYLAYARALSSGHYDASRAILRQVRSGEAEASNPTSELHDGFANSVAAYIASLGLEPVSVNDGSAFGVDFALLHPRTGLYGLGIECEAPCHHDLRTARAREIWRRSVMHKSIPAVHRLTARAWYHEREREQTRLRAAIEAAMQ
jgi:primosomal replication protein N''